MLKNTLNFYLVCILVCVLRFALQNKVGWENSKNIENCKSDAKCKANAKCKTDAKLLIFFKFVSGDITSNFFIRFALLVCVLRFALQNKLGWRNKKNIENCKPDAKCKTNAKCKPDAKPKKIFKIVSDENTLNFLFGLHFWFAFCVLHCKIKRVGEIKKY